MQPFQTQTAEPVEYIAPLSTPPAVRAGRLLGPTEVARWLGVSPAWVRDHATRKQPRIKAVKVGKLLRFRAEDVEAFIGEWCQ
jgi:excisionase family DNA binding protein